MDCPVYPIFQTPILPHDAYTQDSDFIGLFGLDDTLGTISLDPWYQHCASLSDDAACTGPSHHHHDPEPQHRPSLSPSRQSPTTKSSSSANNKAAKARPRCFEHGCNGRTFSCRENYRRHLREKNRAGSVVCDMCGTPFSRKSNRDKHILEGKCKSLAEASVDRVETADTKR